MNKTTRRVKTVTAALAGALSIGGGGFIAQPVYADEVESTEPEVVTVTSAEEFTAFIADGTITGGTVFTLNNLVSWNRFDETLDRDEFNDGCWVISGSPTISTSHAKVGSAFANGGSARAVMYEFLPLGGRDFTVDFWMYITSGSVYAGHAFGLTSSEERPDHRLKIIKGTQCMQIAYPTTAVTEFRGYIGELVHYALVWTQDTSTMRIYMNGRLMMAKTDTAYATRGKCRFCFGWPNDPVANCYIDEFRVHDGSALWTENFTPPTAADYESTFTKDDLIVPADYSVLQLAPGQYAYVQGVGTKASPYVVHNLAEMDAALSSATNATVYVQLAANTDIVGSVYIPSTFESVTIDLNGGSITGDDGEPGISVDIGTYLSLTGTGAVSGGGDAVGVDFRSRYSAASTVTVTDGGLLTLEVDGIRLIYRKPTDVNDIERLIRLIVENATTPVKAAQ